MSGPTTTVIKLTPAMVEVLRYVSQGISPETAFRGAGVQPAAAKRMLAQGVQDFDSGIPTAEALLVDGIRKAEVAFEADLVARISRQASRDWKAGAFLLERRFPATWGLRAPIEPDSGNAVFIADLEDKTDAQLRALASKLSSLLEITAPKVVEGAVQYVGESTTSS